MYSITFRPDLHLPPLQYYNTISTVAVLQAATHVKVLCLRFGVQLDVLLSIELLPLLTSPRLLRYTCSPITSLKRPQVEEVVRPVALYALTSGRLPRRVYYSFGVCFHLSTTHAVYVCLDVLSLDALIFSPFFFSPFLFIFSRGQTMGFRSDRFSLLMIS